MIHVGVLSENRQQAAEFMAENALADDDVILCADDDGLPVGYTALTLELRGALPPILHIKASSYPDEFVLELMLRAAFSYGERRYAFDVITDFSEPESVLARLGFRQIDGQLKSRINNVVHMCRNSAAHDN